MQINNMLGMLLRGVELNKPEIHKPALPAAKVTPPPVTNKVIGDPTRRPVNKQAAMLLSPMRSWISRPFIPDKLPTPETLAVLEMKAELKTERNERARTNDLLGQARALLREARAEIVRLQYENQQLTYRCHEKDSVIQQLEDLKL